MTKFNTRLVAGALAAAASFGLTAGIAHAATMNDETAKSADAPSTQDKSNTDKAQDQRLYCVKTLLTGSRIAHRECKTRAQWLRDGFDPLNPDQ